MSGIVLSSGVRGNLLTLQTTADLMQTTQSRLATGKKVNSALDGPSPFFTAQGLNFRANDLAKLLDDMGQAIQTIKAADQGITAITRLVDAAKAKATQALGTADAFERARFAGEFNDLVGQIGGVAEDSGYNGRNLLSGNDLTIYFNEDNSNRLTIPGVDYGDPQTALGFADLATGTTGTLAVTLADSSSAALTGASLVADDANDFDVGETITLQDGGGNPLGSIEITATMTVNDFVSAVNSTFDQVRATFAAGALTIEVARDVAISGGTAGGALASASVTATESDWLTESGINASLAAVGEANRRLRSQAATLGTSLTVVQNRDVFTRNIINTLQVGADKLVAADQNDEGANLLALQTRQQLATTTLSIAAEAEQNVLRLFG